MVLTNLNINLVSAQHNGNVLANTLKIAVPIWHILIGDSRSDIEHDDAALALDVISITKTTKLFLPGGIPDIETDRAEISGKGKWVDFDTESGYTKKRSSGTELSQLLCYCKEPRLTNVLLLEFTSKMALSIREIRL
jgi:hypothetical protein